MGFGFVLDGSCYCSGVNGCQLGFVPWLSLRMFLQCESTKGTHSLHGLERLVKTGKMFLLQLEIMWFARIPHVAVSSAEGMRISLSIAVLSSHFMRAVELAANLIDQLSYTLNHTF